MNKLFHKKLNEAVGNTFYYKELAGDKDGSLYVLYSQLHDYNYPNHHVSRLYNSLATVGDTMGWRD